MCRWSGVFASMSRPTLFVCIWKINPQTQGLPSQILHFNCFFYFLIIPLSIIRSCTNNPISEKSYLLKDRMMKLPWLKMGLCLFLRRHCVTSTQTQVIKSFQLFPSMQFFHMVVKTSRSLLLNNFWKGLSWVFLHCRLKTSCQLPVVGKTCKFCLNNFCSSFLLFPQVSILFFI